jgi:hypothetical protein
MFGEYTLLYVVLNFIIMFFGVIAHFAKKKIKGETLADIKSYFQTHFKETIVTCIAAIVGFGSLVAAGGLGWAASFLLGYTADSIFNKSSA